MSIENPPLCGTSAAKYFMKFSSAVCQPDDNPQAPFASPVVSYRPEWQFVPGSGVRWDRACAFLWLFRSAQRGRPSADCLLVGFALVGGLLLSAKHLSMAAKAT